LTRAKVLVMFGGKNEVLLEGLHETIITLLFGGLAGVKMSRNRASGASQRPDLRLALAEPPVRPKEL
jgi:hypothetical protein